MTKPMHYTITLNGDEHHITISPVIETIHGSDKYVTGVFKLSEGHVDMGEIVFDDNMNQWEYTGEGDITHREAGEIADFIRRYKEPAADNGFI
ncbi:hypothetical protein SAMN05216490_3053 [Mucilaginibacter mallensis]|uniref:Uncharacterized protein n=2 Tax=Mucilaginibacter mallensis TaxID=652787 RepID=A0A1H1ZCG5_MUCMA|nr:hypothetical protein SAMN05216490_3053 [Mucilaginibacter mallensis]